MLIGAHMSVAGGLHLSFERAVKVGCQTMQIFTKSNRQWNAKPITEEDVAAWQKARAANPVWPVLTHDSYLINLASPNPEIWEKSVAAFIDELARSAMLDIPYLVTHAGAHMSSGEQAGIQRLADTLNRVFRESEASEKVMILLETNAGQDTAIGYKFEHWGEVLAKLDKPERVGICFDTCHVFAAGYDLTTLESYSQTMADFDKYIGLDKLKAFHVNDSKKGLGCRVDRHEAIGQGAMGLEPFRFLMNDPRFADIPKVLETPKGPDGVEDIENLAQLRNLVGTVIL